MGYFAQFGLLVYILTRCATHGKYIEGSLITRETWEFMTRFCFLSDRGRLEFEISFPKEYEPQNILLYYDEPDQWPSVYKSDKTCQEKTSPPHIKPENNQKIVLGVNHFWSGCKYSSDNDTKSKLVQLNCRASRSFKSARERWWFVAASKCGNLSQGLFLNYKMWLTNGGNSFFKHFSADEFYILQVDIAFLVIQFIMLISAIVVGVQLKERQLFHSTYKMYIVAVCFEVGHLLFMCIGYGNYASNGLDGPLRNMKTFARVLEAVSLLTFLLMLILMGKGFTITRGRISTGGSIKIAVFMTLYVITYGILFIYEARFFDPGEVLYLYESPGGYGLIALRLIAWVWFCYAVFITLKHYPEKSSFYFPFLAFYTIWFFMTPIMAITAQFAFGKWYRSKVINGVEVSIHCLSFIFFAILTRPSAANKNFPYHVRTSQIGIMQTSNQNGVPMGASKEDNSFGHHPYAPTSEISSVSNGAPNFTELFQVANTRSSTEQNGTLGKFPHQDSNANPFITTK